VKGAETGGGPALCAEPPYQPACKPGSVWRRAKKPGA
jgi:hypothetical protein